MDLDDFTISCVFFLIFRCFFSISNPYGGKGGGGGGGLVIKPASTNF